MTGTQRRNDAALLQSELTENKSEMLNWFTAGDVYLLGRGYRDVLPFLSQLGFIAKMPPCRAHNQRQLETTDANEARSITMQRWAVEVRNEHIKSLFKFFDSRITYHNLLHLREYYLFAGAMINHFHSPLLMEMKTPELARLIRDRIMDVNVLQCYVELHRLNRRHGNWARLGVNDFADFPRLDRADPERIALSGYQVALAPSYIQDQMLRDDSTEIQYTSPEEPPPPKISSFLDLTPDS